MKVIGLAALAVALIVGAAYAVYQFTSRDSRIAEYQALVTHDMNDPASAQWRGVRMTADGTLCGEVNGKNAFGGYAGFRRFYVSKYGDYPPLVTIDDPRNFAVQDVFNKMWPSMCEGAPLPVVK